MIQQNCSSTQHSKLIGLEDQTQTLFSILQRTLEGGENHSVLLVGGSGSGKSACVEWAIHKLKM